MIQRFRFGLPLPTDSVVQEIPVSAGPVPFLTAEEDGWAYRISMTETFLLILISPYLKLRPSSYLR